MRILRVLVWWVLFPPLVLAQGVLRGSVRQDSTGAPLPGVEIIAEGTGKRTTSDRDGWFALRNLPYGPQTILFRHIGYRPVKRGVLVLREDTVRVEVFLISEAAQRLEPITVTARPDPPAGRGIREDFEDRRRLGFGKFIDSTVLRANEHRRMSDLLRGIPGLQFAWVPDLDCYGRNRCPPVLYLKGTRTSRVTGPCFMTIIEDGMVRYRSDGTSPPPDWSREFYVNEYEAVEVYRSSAELPIEFSGASSQCGVIVLWTRRGR